MLKPIKNIITLTLILIVSIIGFTYLLNQQPGYIQKEKPLPICGGVVYPDGYLEGKEIFKRDCYRCHKKGKTHDFLAGVVQIRGREFVKLYITKEDSLIKAKDTLALKINAFWNGGGNNHNYNYSNEELDCLMTYLR